jgi:ATP-binding protein involved in chromosome partitioning
LNDKELYDVLRSVKYPGFSRDIVSFGLVNSVGFQKGIVQVNLSLVTAHTDIPQKLHDAVELAFSKVEGVEKVNIHIQVTAPKNDSHSNNLGQGKLSEYVKDIRFIIAIASGKGGVGKSTFSVNFACALDAVLRQKGMANQVGLLDCDIYGPSIPVMMGLNEQPEIEGERFKPLENFGIRLMSMGFLIDEFSPVVWRGPMVTKTIQQFITDVHWGSLEVLVVDLPPGTGDAHLSLVQNLNLKGAIIVTTPQTVATSITCRGAMMFEKVKVPILGVVENMSYFENQSSGEKEYLFGKGGGALSAQVLNTTLLGQIPLDPLIRIGCDQGIPIVISHFDTPSAQAFYAIAQKVIDTL